MFFISFSTGASQSQSQSRDVEAMARAQVDIRKLQQFLMGQQVNPTKAMCSEYLIRAIQANKHYQQLLFGKNRLYDLGLWTINCPRVWKSHKTNGSEFMTGCMKSLMNYE